MVVKGWLVGQETEIKAHLLPGIQKWLSDSVSLEAGLSVWTPLLTDPAGFPLHEMQARCPLLTQLLVEPQRTQGWAPMGSYLLPLGLIPNMSGVLTQVQVSKHFKGPQKYSQYFCANVCLCVHAQASSPGKSQVKAFL